MKRGKINLVFVVFLFLIVGTQFVSSVTYNFREVIFDDFQTTGGNFTLNDYTAAVCAWLRNVAGDGTSSGSTGPEIDNTIGSVTSGGRFAFVETSSGGCNTAGNTATLESPSFTPGSFNTTLEFYYHMYGTEMGTMYVDVYNGTWFNNVWNRVGQQHTSQTQAYTLATVNLTGSGNVTQIRFRDVAAGGYRGDMAIDDIRIVSVDILNEPPSTPTNLTCEGGSCEITINNDVDLNCSGSVDFDGDSITYLIDALLNETYIYNENTGYNFSSYVQGVSKDDTPQFCSTFWGFDCGAGPPESGDNTMDSCANGLGTDESVERIYLNVTSVEAGDRISVTCEFDPYTSNDDTFIWYYNGTGWRNLYSHTNWGSASITNESITFTADNVVGTHWVRCGIIYVTGSDIDECMNTGSYYDNDDVTFEVIDSVLTETDINYTPINYNVFYTDYDILESLDIIVTVDRYLPYGSIQGSSNKPDLILELYDGLSWKYFGEFNLEDFYTGSGLQEIIYNFTLSITDPALINAWENSSNQKLRITPVYFDFVSSLEYDEINYTDVFVSLGGVGWYQIGEQNVSSVYSWNTTERSSQVVSLRCAATDLLGSGLESSSYESPENLIIDHDYFPSLPPTFSLVLPLNNSEETSDSTPSFSYNITDDYTDLMDCFLYLNNGTLFNVGRNQWSSNATTSSISSNMSLQNGNYSWWVNCSDGGYEVKSELRILNITLPPQIDNFEFFGESGSMDFSDNNSVLVAFDYYYDFPPIVLATPVTQNAGVSKDNSALITKINSINTTHFMLGLCMDDGLPTCQPPNSTETINYFVFSRNATYPSWIDVGVLENVATDGSDNNFAFSKTFANKPAIFINAQTYNQNGNIAATAWADEDDGTTSAGQVLGCTHQGTADACDTGGPTENFGWVAIDLANVEFSSFMNFQSGGASITASAWTFGSFGSSYVNPVVNVMQNDDNGAQDPQYSWARNVGATSLEFRYCEQDGSDDCDSHNGEQVYWFAMEKGMISSGSDNVIPTINVVSPEEGQYFTSSPVSFNLTIDEMAKANYTLDGGITNYTMNYNSNRTIFWSFVSGLNESLHQVVFYVWDQLNNFNSEIRNFLLDSLNPTLDYVLPTPTDNKYISATSFIVNITFIEDNFKNITYYLYNSTGLKTKRSFSSEVTSTTFSSLSTGQYNYNVTIYDLSGKKGSTSTRTLNIDVTNPVVSFSTGTDPDYNIRGGDYVYVNVSVTESNEQNITFVLYDDIGIVRSNTFTDGTHKANWTNIIDGTYYYNVSVYDKAGNFGVTPKRTLILDNTPPVINYISPTLDDNLNITQDYLFVNVSVVEENEDQVTFYLYNSSGLVYETTFVDGTHELNWTNLADTSYEYNVTVQDISGYTDSTETRRINIDRGKPLISFVSSTELNGTAFLRDWIYANVSIIETNLANLTFDLYLNGILINQQIFTDNTREYNWTVLTNGIYFYNVTAYDTSGNFNKTETRRIILDTAGPYAVIVDPKSKTYGYNTSLPLNYIVTESLTSLSNCWWNLDEGINRTLTCGVNTTFNTGEGLHTLKLFANDTLGNIGIKERIFSVSTLGPSIALVSPEDDYFYNVVGDITLNYTASDPDDVSSCSLYGNWNGGWHLNESDFNWWSTPTEISFFDNFDDADLGIDWTTYSSNAYSRIVVGTTGAHSPSYSVVMDSTTNGQYELSELITNQDFTGANNIILDFWFTDWGDETHNGADHTSHQNGDAVYYTCDGNRWFMVYNVVPATRTNGVWNNVNVNISADSDFCMEVNESFAIKFTQYDNYAVTTDGIGWDDIYINYTGVLQREEGNFTVSLPDGDYFWNIYCNDSLNQFTWAPTNFTFGIDINAPLVDFSTGTLANNSIINYNSLFVNVSVVEPNEENISFGLYSSAGTVRYNTYADGTHYVNWSSLSDGTYKYNVSVYDKGGKENHTSTRIVKIDKTAPIITINSPQTLTYLINDIWFNLSLNEPGFCNYSLNAGTTNFTMTNVSNLFSGYQENLSDGSYTVYYYCRDLAKNYKLSKINFGVDATPPIVTFSTGTVSNGTVITQDFIYLNVSVIESNEANITFKLFDDEGNIFANVFTDKRRNINWTLLIDDDYYYNVTVYDNAGLAGSTETRKISLDHVAPVVAYDFDSYPDYDNRSQDFIYTSITLAELHEENNIFGLYFKNGTLINSTILGIGTRNMTWINLSNGIYWYNVTSIDGAGLKDGTITRQITLDTISPIVTFSSGTESDLAEFERSWIYVNVSLNELYPRNSTFYLYNSTGLINQTNFLTTITSFNFSNLNHENTTYYYNVSFSDFSGNKDNTSTRQIKLLDLTPPQITIISPENKTYNYNESIILETSIIENHLDSCWYNINGGSNYSVANCSQITFDVADEQQHVVNFFANDTLGQVGSSQVTFFTNSSLIFTLDYLVLRGSEIGIDGSRDVTVDEIDPTKSFVLLTSRSSDSGGDSLQFTSNFVNTNTLRFENYASGAGGNIEWTLVTGPDIRVKRGELSYGTGDSTVGEVISAVNLSNSFIIVNSRLDDGTSANNVRGFFTGKFVNDSYVQFQRGTTGSAGVVSYQVISWAGTSVQSGSSQATTTASVQGYFNSINVNRTFVIASNRLSGDNSIQDLLMKVSLVNSTTAQFERWGNGGTMNIEWFVVTSEMFDSQNGNFAVAASAAPQYDSIDHSVLDTSRSFNVASYESSGTGNIFSNGFATQQLFSSSQVAVQKGTVSNNGEANWFVIEIRDSTPPEINLTYPIQNKNFKNNTVERFSFLASDKQSITNCSIYGNWSGWENKQTIYSVTSETLTNFSSKYVGGDGYFIWNVMCSDLYGNRAYETSNFTFSAFFPPTEPISGNITQTSNDGAGNVTFNWIPSTHAVKYKIYEGNDLNNLVNTINTTSTNYTYSNLSNTDKNYFKIVSVNPSGENETAELFGVHKYTLNHNGNTRNFIGFPTNFSYIKNANESYQEISNAVSFTMYNATTQKKVTCNQFSCPETFACTETSCNFNLKPGRGYQVDLNSSGPSQVNWSGIGKVYSHASVNLISNDPSFLKSENWISLPADTTLVDARDLMDSVGNTEYVARWNSQDQTSEALLSVMPPFIRGFNLNWGEGYAVSMTANSTWVQE